MIGKLIKLLASSVTARWVTGFTVTLLLGGSWAAWHNHKQNLREEGIRECVQEINQATVDELQRQLANEVEANARLADELEVANQANASALDRRRELETSLTALAAEMEAQRNEDPTYREWSDSDLPDGVADRLRDAAGSQADRDD